MRLVQLPDATVDDEAMALIRCTCIYRAAPAPGGDSSERVVEVAAADPWCPSAHLHAKARVDETEPQA